MFNVNAFIVSQTNPWLLPFLTPEDGGGTWGDTFNFKLFKTIKRLLLMEFRHRVQQLNFLNLFDALTWFLGIFTQEYRGHVTIWPVPAIKDYLNILSNPSDDDIQKCIKKGNIRTFPKINMLKSIMVIEKTFESCCEELKEILKVKESKWSVTVDGYSEDFPVGGKIKSIHIEEDYPVKDKITSIQLDASQEVIVDAQ